MIAPVSFAATLVVALFAFAAPALADTGHAFSGAFGSAGSAAGQFTEPEGVAANDETGDVYVVDKGNNRVEYFSATATGTYEGEFNGSGLNLNEGVDKPATGRFVKPEWIAVDNDISSPSHGDVYVTDNGHKVVDKFSATGAYLGQLTGTCPAENESQAAGKCEPSGTSTTPFSGFYGVAVDTEGKLWLYQSSGEIDDYSDAVANEFVASRHTPAEPGPGFTVGPEGDLYPVFSTEFRWFTRLTSAGESTPNEYPPTSKEYPWGREAATAAAFDSAGEAYVDDITTVGAFSPTFTLNQRFGQGHLTSGAGIAVNSSSGTVYVADSAGDDVAIFAQGSTPEAPKTEAAEKITATTATLKGALKPPATTLKYYFEYNAGTSCTEGAETSVEEGQGKVSQDVTKLEPSAQYTFCLVAENAFGSTFGQPETLTTGPAPPEVVSESAPGAEETKTTLAAKINPNNQETTYVFEYATNESEIGTPGATIVAEVEPPLTGFSAEGDPVSVKTEVALTSETVYYYRAVAENIKHEKAAPGTIEHFTTGPPEEPETLMPDPIGTTTAVFKGVLNPHKPGDPGEYEFRYKEGSSCSSGNHTRLGSAAGAESEHVSTEVKGLLPNATYSVCVLALNEAGEATLGAPVTFTTHPVTLTLSAEAATDITTNSAVLNATVDPNGAEVTACEFEYGTEAGVYPNKLACSPSPGSGRTAVAVSAQLEKLSANTEYHWRLVATNAAGTSTSPDHTFFYPTTGEGLPDGREYEMVTPPQKNGALIGVGIHSAIGVQESADGTRVISGAIQCLLDSEGCTGDRGGAGEPYEFVRTSSGWVTHPLAPPATELASNGVDLFNADAGTALFRAPNLQHTGRVDFYARSGNGVFSDVGPITPEHTSEAEGEEVRTAATPDLSHVLYELSSLRWPGDETIVNTVAKALYEYEGAGGSEPRLVGVSGGPGSKQLESACGTYLGSTESQYGALSADGETVYFTVLGHDIKACPTGATAPPAGELYARYEHARTEPISVPASAGEACDAECRAQPAGDAQFDGASSDGSRVFFTDTQKLTDSASEDSHAGDTARGGRCSEAASGFSGCNLYESICPDRCAVAGTRELVDVSAGDTSGLGPRVQGVVATSTDGSHVYFIAQGVLTSTPNSQGQHPQNGLENLYAYERDASAPTGRLAFVATLAEADQKQWQLQDEVSNVTPDGRFLVFTSHRALTRDDIRGEGPAQVYRYDAQTGELLRISKGEQGFNDNGNAGLVGGEGGDGPGTDAGDAHIVPSGKSDKGGAAGPQREDPTMSDNGEYVFFQSPVGLTPQALNDVRIVVPSNYPYAYAQNVYEYHAGHVSLISDGRDTSTVQTYCPAGPISATCLLGSDASGHNVFFTTADPLVPADTDTQLDYYDARICEPSSPCIQPAPASTPPCLGEQCHGTPAATPSLLTPGSASFNGRGNIAPAPPVKPKSLTRAQKLASALKSCKKDKKKAKRATCERQARAKYGPVKKKAKSKKASNDRRGR